jgi:hypothetical protein
VRPRYFEVLAQHPHYHLVVECVVLDNKHAPLTTDRSHVERGPTERHAHHELRATLHLRIDLHDATVPTERSANGNKPHT